MAIAHTTADLASQPHPGVGARLVRRIGGAVRTAIAGISRFARRTPPVLPQAGRRTQEAPQPVPPTTPRRSGRRESHSASAHPRHDLRAGRRVRGADATPFTPEAFPELTAEACAVLNTPLEECDPAILELLFSALIQYLAGLTPAEPGTRDPEAVVAGLWGRLNTALDAARHSAETTAQPAVPVTPDTGPSHGSSSSGRLRLSRRKPAHRDRRPSNVHGRQARSRRTSFRPGRSQRPCCLPPRRLCYAACAGPP